jgi:hypothetical protein
MAKPMTIDDLQAQYDHLKDLWRRVHSDQCDKPTPEREAFLAVVACLEREVAEAMLPLIPHAEHKVNLCEKGCER